MLIELPDIEASEIEINEFIEFETGFGCQMSATNPFIQEGIEVLECYIEDKEVIQ